MVSGGKLGFLNFNWLHTNRQPFSTPAHDNTGDFNDSVYYFKGQLNLGNGFVVHNHLNGKPLIQGHRQRSAEKCNGTRQKTLGRQQAEVSGRNSDNLGMYE